MAQLIAIELNLKIAPRPVGITINVYSSHYEITPSPPLLPQLKWALQMEMK